MCNFSTRARYSRASQKVPSVGASLTRRVREEILFSHWNFSPPAKHCFASQAKNDNYLNEKDNNPFYLKDNKSNPEYVRYVEQFFVGLLEGDGSITSSLRTKGKKNRVVIQIEISLKNEPGNLSMLKVIQEIIGGRVLPQRKDTYLTW